MILFLAARARQGERVDPEPARAALARLLAVAPVAAPAAIETWAAPSGRAAFAWVGSGAHARDGAAALVSGRPIRWTGEDADGRSPLEPASYLEPVAAWAPTLDGRWAAAAYDEASGELRVAADALGAHPLFRRETAVARWYGNAPGALHGLGADPGEPSAPEPLAGLLAGGWPLSGDSWWPDVTRLARGAVVRDTGGARVAGEELLPLAEVVRMPGAGVDADVAAALLVGALRALADWPGRESLVPVTGGRDSRVVLAAALAAGFPFAAVTAGGAEDPDVVSARALCAAAGIPHRRIGAQPGGDVWSDPGRAGRVVGAMAAGTACLDGAGGFPLVAPSGPVPLWHTGQGGEIGRAYYGRAPRDAAPAALVDSLARAFTGRRPGRRPPLTPPARARSPRRSRAGSVRSWVRAPRPRTSPISSTSCAAWAPGPGRRTPAPRRRTSRPLSSGAAACSRTCSGPRRPSAPGTACTDGSWPTSRPALMDVPFADGEGWDGPGRGRHLARRARRLAGQALGEARRRTRRPPAPATGGRSPAPAADPFSGPQAAVRAAAAARPGHPVWAYADRDRAAGLLEARPEDLDWMGRAYVCRLGTVLLGSGP